jgi:hypothetical protein
VTEQRMRALREDHPLVRVELGDQQGGVRDRVDADVVA